MRDYKLIAIDADGTLLDSNRNISKENILAISGAIEKGVKVVLCSGRSFASLRYFAEEAGIPKKGGHIIAFNGGAVHDFYSGEMLLETKLDKTIASRALKLTEGFEGIERFVYRDFNNILIEKQTTNSDYYVETSKANPIYVKNLSSAVAKEAEDISKVLMLGTPEDLKHVHDFIYPQIHGIADVIFSASYLLEIMKKGTGKGETLVWLCQRLGFDMCDVIAIGDNFNDISMIKMAGLGVAMANAEKEVAAMADYVTVRDNNNSGVGEVINKFILA